MTASEAPNLSQSLFVISPIWSERKPIIYFLIIHGDLFLTAHVKPVLSMFVNLYLRLTKASSLDYFEYQSPEDEISVCILTNDPQIWSRVYRYIYFAVHFLNMCETQNPSLKLNFTSFRCFILMMFLWISLKM